MCLGTAFFPLLAKPTIHTHRYIQQEKGQKKGRQSFKVFDPRGLNLFYTKTNNYDEASSIHFGSGPLSHTPIQKHHSFFPFSKSKDSIQCPAEIKKQIMVT